jgi:hypothetical protein
LLISASSPVQPIQVLLQPLFLTDRAQLVLHASKSGLPLYIHRAPSIRACDYNVQRGMGRHLALSKRQGIQQHHVRILAQGWHMAHEG